MKQSMNVEQLTQEVERQAGSRQDFLLHTKDLKLISETGSHEPVSLLSTPNGQFGMTDLALEQLAGQVGMPLRYLKRLQQVNSHLLDLNINTLLLQEPKQRLVRTLDGKARAFLSNRYRRLDNDALLEAVWPVFDDVGGLTVGSSDLSQQRLYLKMVSPKLTADVRVGDAVQAGLVISNSEVGCGAISVELMIYRLVCTNGAIVGDGAGSTKRYHFGGTMRGKDGPGCQLPIDEANDALFWNELRETVRIALDERHFQEMLGKMQESARAKLEAAPDIVVGRLAGQQNLTDGERDAILLRLLESSDMTQWGLANAVTRMSQDAAHYERATELERLGGRLLQLRPNEWRGLSMN